MLSPLPRSPSLTAKRHSTPFVLGELTEASVNHEREVGGGLDRPPLPCLLKRRGRSDLNGKQSSRAHSSLSLSLCGPDVGLGPPRRAGANEVKHERERKEGREPNIAQACACRSPWGHLQMTSALRKGDILSEFVTDKGGEGPKILKF